MNNCINEDQLRQYLEKRYLKIADAYRQIPIPRNPFEDVAACFICERFGIKDADNNCKEFIGRILFEFSEKYPVKGIVFYSRVQK